MGRFNGKPLMLRFTPIIVSTGTSLVGKYYINISLFNSKSKVRFSDWLESDDYVLINQEHTKAIKSCRGIKEENKILPQSRSRSIKDFKIR